MTKLPRPIFAGVLSVALIAVVSAPITAQVARSTADRAAVVSGDAAICGDTARDTDDRVKACRTVVAGAPGDAAAHARLGGVLFDAGELEEALPSLREAVRLAPDNAVHRHRLAEALYYLDHDDEAVAEYREAVRLDPKFTRAHVDLAEALAYLDRNEEALRRFDDAIAVEPAGALAYERKAGLLAELERYDDALAVYAALAAARPADPHPHALSGLLLMELERFPEAVAAYRSALAVAPEDAPTHNDLGVVLQRMGNSAAALDSYREASRLDPGMGIFVQNVLAALIELGRGDEALRIAEERTLSRPDAESFHTLGSVQLALERNEAALASARESIARDSTYVPGHLMSSIALLQMERLEEALVSSLALTRIVPREPRGWALAGLTAFAMERAEDAVGYLSEARRLSPGLFREQPVLEEAFDQALAQLARRPPAR